MTNHRARVLGSIAVLLTGGLATLEACSSDGGSSVTAAADGGSVDGTATPDATNPTDAAMAIDTATADDTGPGIDSATGDAGSGDAAKADAADAADAAPFAPSDIGTNLVLWLEADRGVTINAGNGAVAAWNDQSTFGNNATVASVATPLTLNTTGVHGKPSIHFSGTMTYLSIPDSVSLDFGSSDVTTWVIVSGTSPLASSSRIVWTKQNTAGSFVGFGMFMNLANTYGLGAILSGSGPFAQVNAVDMMTYDNGSPLFLIGSRTATELSLAVGAITVMTSPNINDAGANLTNTSALRIGGQGGSDQALTGDIAAILIAAGTVSTKQQSDIAQYLATKYGF